MYGSEKQEKLMNPLWWQVPFGALLLALIFTCNKTVLDLSEQSHCPFCYGNDFCPALKDASLQYNTLQKITFNVLSVKNVFFAHLGERELVLKKLADYGDFFKFNQDVIQSESLLKLLSDQSRNFHTCSGASAKRLLERLPARNLANLWTIVNVNVEPLLLELFRKEDKWPVPQLFGYCGRLVVEENCGVPLNDVQTFEWHHRAHIALQLLQAAEKFTMGHADFRLYMTDISPDNIAVNLRNFTVAFVDLEHGILQEILPEEPSTTSHYSEHMPEEDYAFSSDLICGRSISDHNIYAVCKLLLSPSAPWPMMSGGLLHSPAVSSEDLFSHIRLCEHSANATSRFVLGRTIHEILLDRLNSVGYYEGP